MSADPHRSDSALRRRPRRAVFAAAAAVVALAAGLAAYVVLARQHDTPAAAGPVSKKALIVPSDRTLKANLVEALPRPPQVIILGGSRALRFEPSYIEKKTGLRGFNAAASNGRAEDAWAWVNYLHHLHPKAKMSFFWPLQVEAFREQGLAFGIVQDKRFSRYFPASLVAAQRRRLPTTQAEMPKGKDLASDEYAADGSLIHNRYDIRIEKGAKLDTALDWSIRTMTKRYQTFPEMINPQATTYFEKTLGLMNRLGATPVLVLMPVQPRVLAGIRSQGWSARHEAVLKYLDGLRGRYRFAFYDFSVLSSIGGDPLQFYDGVHVMLPNARKVIDTVLARDPQAFDLPR